jgi:hypothetical protein
MKMIDNVDTKTFADQKARDWLIGVLCEQSVTVTFTKQDGTERVMNCTCRSSTQKLWSY